MEEVQWALQRVRKDAAPGKDEVGSEMMMAHCLADVCMTEPVSDIMLGI